jgi:hypothetical protein
MASRRPGMGHAHDDLAGADHLAGFGQGFHHHAIGVRHQLGVTIAFAATSAWASAELSCACAASAAAFTWS